MPSTVPFRVVLTQGGVSRKFFTLLQGSDGSLYIHPNRDKSKPWKIPKLGNASDGMTIDFGKWSEPKFEPHKISFHPSGFIHVTNATGERFQDGIRGPTFEEMQPLHLLCFVAPSKLSEMPAYTKDDKKCMLVNLVLPDSVPPFVVTMALGKTNPGPAEDDGSLITNRFILPLNSGHFFVFLLRAVLPRTAGAVSSRPSFPLFVLRTGA